MDGMVVSRHCLGALVRATAINAHLACLRRSEALRHPYAPARTVCLCQVKRRALMGGLHARQVCSAARVY
jgi:hypothetical protein